MAAPYTILERKQAGEELAESDVQAVVDGAVDGSWTEGQLAAFLMAVAIRGLTIAETRSLTRAMRDSGESWDLGSEVATLCDKHSTGGVGDKVSLILSPLLAACGLPVAMLTGRGLGHTGGTADKLETIPGLDLSLDRRRCLDLLERVGMAIGLPTADIAPADKRLYLLRDSTATVASIPLITASILSKKLATGSTALVFDVKSGNGAFSADPARAEALARSLVETAQALGQPCSALLTDMNQPLGSWVGNASEVRESLDCLAGDGAERLMELVFSLCEEVSALSGAPLSRDELQRAVSSGRARDRFERWISAQGGEVVGLDAASCELAPVEVVVEAETGGWLGAVETKRLGMLLVEAGGGRTRPDDIVDPAVALYYRARLGDRVEKGDEIARAYLRHEDGGWVDELRACFGVVEAPAAAPPAVLARIA